MYVSYGRYVGGRSVCSATKARQSFAEVAADACRAFTLVFAHDDVAASRLAYRQPDGGAGRVRMRETCGETCDTSGTTYCWLAYCSCRRRRCGYQNSDHVAARLPLLARPYRWPVRLVRRTWTVSQTSKARGPFVEEPGCLDCRSIDACRSQHLSILVLSPVEHAGTAPPHCHV